MKIRISWKLTTIFCLTIFLVLTALYFYVNNHLKEYLEQRIQYNLKHDLILSKSLIETEPKSSLDPANAPATADKIGKSLNVRVTIVDTRGTVIGDSELGSSELHSIENHITRPEIQDSIKKEFGESKRFSTTKKTWMLYMAAPLGDKGKLGFIRLAMPLSEIETIELKMQKIILGAIVLAILLSFALSAIISAMISKPLSEMSSVATSMAKGNFSKKIFSHSNDEIGELAKTLNYMAEELKNKIDKIYDEETKLEAIISNMFEGVMLTNKGGEIIMINPSLKKLFLIDSPVQGKRPIEVMRNNNIQNALNSIIEGKSRSTAEITLISGSEEKAVIINGVPIIKDGAVEGVIMVFHDITELKRLERIRQDFVANVSHELRTPLSNIKGYSETLLEGAIEDKKHASDFIGIIHREADRLAKLIDDLLDISKIEAGKIKMTFSPVNTEPIARRVVEILGKSAHDKSINMKFNMPPDLPKILADEDKIAQALINLVDNAIKYTPQNGTINISALKDGRKVLIEVSDTGIGIPEKDLPRIFERFYRVDKARSRELGGTGLGLSIVKHIVQIHGGEVSVRSVLGKGSTFSFSIPIA